MDIQRKRQLTPLRPPDNPATVKVQINLGRQVAEQAEAHLRILANAKRVVVVRGSEMKTVVPLDTSPKR